MQAPNPYDAVPYRSLPIEWTAPERLALASLLHGGPRLALDGYRVLELGCGDGSNLLPLAYFRAHANFVGVDGSHRAIEIADARRAELKLGNLELVHSDFRSADDKIAGRFDFVIAHGIFSWVSDETRDALFALCARHLRPGGLLYLNYNAKPGWNVRGMVRDFLLAETAAGADLASRAGHAQELAAKVAASLGAAGDHPYSRLLEREFRLVVEHHVSYVAHEYLSPHNRAYWQREFAALAHHVGLEHVAEADFNYASGRVPEGLTRQIADARLIAQPLDDTVDLLSYRQLHSPILTLGPCERVAPSQSELMNLVVASCLEPLPAEPSGTRMFRHPTGFEVEAKHEVMRASLERLRTLWPRGVAVGALFPQETFLIDDLRLLYLHGLIDLRMVESDDRVPPQGPLNDRERVWGGYVTSRYHTSSAQRSGTDGQRDVADRAAGS
jgi:SAM-dependent methyltransferase